MSSSGGEDVGGGSELSDSILALITPAIAQLDNQVVQTRLSQTALCAAIEEVSEQLRKVSEQPPYDMADYARKLADSQNRVQNVGKRLEALTDRLGKLQRDMARDKFAAKSGLQAPPPAAPAR